MPAVIKSNASFSGGQLALVSYELADSLDLSANISATFVSLDSAKVDSLFRPGSPVPFILAQNSGYVALLDGKKLLQPPTLASCTITIANGLKTIDATYTAEVETPGVVEGEGDSPNRDLTSEISTQTEQRSLSGSYKEGETTISFVVDYLVTTVTYDQSFAATGSISDEFADTSTTIALSGSGDDRYGITITRQRPRNKSLPLSIQPIQTIRTYRNNLGQARVSVTRTAQIVQNN